jgi:hypothetical protein
MLFVAMLMAAAYWMVRGIPITGRVAEALEHVLSDAFDWEVELKSARYHVPGVVMVTGLHIKERQEEGEEPEGRGAWVAMKALRLRGKPWKWKQGIDMDVHGLVISWGDVRTPRIPIARARVIPEPGGLAWKDVEIFLPIAGQPGQISLPSGFVKREDSLDSPGAVEFQTDMELSVQQFGMRAQMIGNGHSAQLVGQVGFSEDGAHPLHCEFKYGEGNIWIDPIQFDGVGDLEAHVDLKTSTLFLSRVDGAVDGKFRLDLPNDLLQGEFQLQHWTLGQWNIVSRTEFDLAWSSGDPLYPIRGQVTISDLVMNLKPVDPIAFSFHMNPEKMSISEARWGEKYRAQGLLDFDLKEMDLDIDIQEGGMGDWQFTGPAASTEFAGTVNGELSIKGPWEYPEVEGDIIVSNGRLLKLGPFESMNVHFEGQGWRWQLKESTIYKETGSFLLTGHIDLERDDIFKHIEVEGHEGVMVLDGMDIASRDENMVELVKEVGGKFKVNFKTYLNEASAARIEQDEIAVEYGIGEKESLKMRLRGEEQFLGLQRKSRF